MSQAAGGFSARAALRAPLCALTIAALAVRLPGVQSAAPTALSVLPDGAVWALMLGALWLGYGAWLKREKPFSAAWYWELAALFALVVTLGQSYAAVGGAGLVTGQPWLALLCFTGRVPLYYAGMFLLGDALSSGGNGAEGRLLRSAQNNRSGFQHGMGFAAALLLCWLPYLYFIFPGTVSNDSVTQIMEIIGVETLGNANPLFQTALVYLFRGIGKVLGSADIAVALYCLLQALLMAWLLGALLWRMKSSAAPRWLYRLSFAFYAFCPIFPLFTFCMGKDTNFSMAVCWLMLLALGMLRPKEPDRPSRAQVACLCLAGALCTLLRNPGVYLAALTLLLLLGYALLHRRERPQGWRAPAAALGCVLAVYGVLHLAVIPALGVAPMPETEHMSLPLQQVARVTTAHPLTDEEAKAVDGALELNRLADAYNGELSDPVKLLWRKDATQAQKAAFLRAWLALAAKHPATCLSATFHNAYGYLTPGYMSTIKPTLLIGRQKRSTPEVEAAFGYTVNPRADALKAFTDSLAENPLYRALISPGLYGWLTLFACATLLRRKPKRLLIAAFPALFSLAGCLLSAVNGYFRYALPLYLCAPLLLWLCALAAPKQPIKSCNATGRNPL